MRAVYAVPSGCLALSALLIAATQSLPAARADACVSGVITTVAGSGEQGYSGDGAPAIQATLALPVGVAVGPDGVVYIADTANHCIRRISDGRIDTVVGKGVPGYSGDGGPATEARLNEPRGVAVGTDGAIYIADSLNNRIAKVGPTGIITTVAGSGTAGYAGDGGPATDARLQNPYGVAVGPDGAILIADTKNHRIRKVDAGGNITTLAGRSGRGRYYGDGGPAAEARLNEPYSVALGPDGALYIADTLNHRIRRIDADGIITTVAGGGMPRYGGDDGLATRADLHSPTGIAVDADGLLYIADMGNRRVRRVQLLNGQGQPAGTITTVAGCGDDGYWGDDGPANEAALGYPRSVALTTEGSLYVADSRNHCIRTIRWRPCDAQAAAALADRLKLDADNLPRVWREVAELYMIAQAWDPALAAAERLLAAAPEGDAPERLRAEVIVARVYAAKREDHEARRRLMNVLVRARDPAPLREAADVLVALYLLRGERDQAMAALDDLRLRTQDGGLLDWAAHRLKSIAGE